MSFLQTDNLAGDIREKRRFETFAYRVSYPWVVLLFAITMPQGFEFWRFNLEKSAFYRCGDVNDGFNTRFLLYRWPIPF